MFYDVGQGQGWQRNIVMNGSPHLPANIRQMVWRFPGPLGGQHARRRCDKFQPQDDFQGSRENLHLVERWTPSGSTLRIQVTIEDPTVWVHQWTVRQEFDRQGERE